jgi:hypothetical protein
LNGEEKSGFMKSCVIQGIINQVWFKSAKGKADTIALKTAYQPFPLVAIALVLTAVCNSLDLISF